MVDERAQFAADLTLRLYTGEGPDAVIRRMAEVTGELAGTTCSGVMFVPRSGRCEAAYATGDVARQVGALPPWDDAVPRRRPGDGDGAVVIDDVETESRWVRWCRAAAALGVRSVLSMSLPARHGALGVLELYSPAPGAFSSVDRRYLATLGEHASVALVQARTEVELRTAMVGRHTIGLAQGMLMERFDLDPDQAFDVLRRYSQEHNTKLRLVAERFIRRDGPGRIGENCGDA